EPDAGDERGTGEQTDQRGRLPDALRQDPEQEDAEHQAGDVAGNGEHVVDDAAVEIARADADRDLRDAEADGQEPCGPQSLASAVAEEFNELDRVDIAAENTAPSTTPSTPTGMKSTMNAAKTRSARANCGTGSCWP